MVAAADLDACQPHNCSGTANAVAGSCVDLAAPSLGYSCSCQTGYSWNPGGLTCEGEQRDNMLLDALPDVLQ
jgi:hypothetical protein